MPVLLNTTGMSQAGSIPRIKIFFKRRSWENWHFVSACRNYGVEMGIEIKDTDRTRPGCFVRPFSVVNSLEAIVLSGSLSVMMQNI